MEPLDNLIFVVEVIEKRITSATVTSNPSVQRCGRATTNTLYVCGCIIIPARLQGCVVGMVGGFDRGMVIYLWNCSRQTSWWWVRIEGDLQKLGLDGFR